LMLLSVPFVILAFLKSQSTPQQSTTKGSAAQSATPAAVPAQTVTPGGAEGVAPDSGTGPMQTSPILKPTPPVGDLPGDVVSGKQPKAGRNPAPAKKDSAAEAAAREKARRREAAERALDK
jgi:hypothetical protein